MPTWAMVSLTKAISKEQFALRHPNLRLPCRRSGKIHHHVKLFRQVVGSQESVVEVKAEGHRRIAYLPRHPVEIASSLGNATGISRARPVEAWLKPPEWTDEGLPFQPGIARLKIQVLMELHEIGKVRHFPVA